MAKVISLASFRAQRTAAPSRQQVEREFERIRKTLQRPASTHVAPQGTWDWDVLFAIQKIIESALRDSDWGKARRQIAAIKRGAGIRIVRAR